MVVSERRSLSGQVLDGPVHGDGETLCGIPQAEIVVMRPLFYSRWTFFLPRLRGRRPRRRHLTGIARQSQPARLRRSKRYFGGGHRLFGASAGCRRPVRGW